MKQVTYAEVSQALGGKLLWNANNRSINSVPEEVYFLARLAELVIQLHDKHPSYTFTPARANKDCNEGVCIYRLRVAVGGSTLGDVQEWDDAFTLTGDRISRAKPRTESIRTKDIKRAVREFTKYFKPKTELEDFKEQVKRVAQALWNAENAARNKKALFMSVVEKFLLGHIADNFETYADIAKGAGASGELVGNAMAALEESRVLHSVTEKGGYAVITDTGRYMVSPHNDFNKVTVYEAEHLPKNINDKLGKLKLLPCGTHLRDTGLRVDDHMFFITEQSDE